MFIVKLRGEDRWVRLEVVRNGYAAGSLTRVDVWDQEGPYARLSVNLPDHPLPDPDMFWLKSWSENTDIAMALIASGKIALVEDIDPVGSGYVAIHAARIV